MDIAVTLNNTFLSQFFGAYEVSEINVKLYYISVSLQYYLMNYDLLCSAHFFLKTPACIGLLFEFAYGGCLRTRIATKKYLEENEAKFYFCEIACALQYLHETARVIHRLVSIKIKIYAFINFTIIGFWNFFSIKIYIKYMYPWLYVYYIFYRDIRTDNILIDSRGHVKLCDFGLAISINDVDKLTQLPPIILNPTLDLTAYMAPEVLNHEQIIEGCESKIDYFSLGFVLLEMLTGKPPPPPSVAVVSQNNIIKSSIVKLPWFMNKQLKILIQGLLDPHPLHRYGFELIAVSLWLTNVSAIGIILLLVLLFLFLFLP